MRKLEINPGDKFGNLTVSRVFRIKTNTYIDCMCDCFDSITITMSRFRSKKMIKCKSCGEINQPIDREIQTQTLLDSKSRWKENPTYRSWQAMKTRCTNPNHEAYERYKHLGFCERWENFENFLEDMGERPENTTLERKDNTLGYSSDNCIWASMKVQSENKSNVKQYTYQGQTKNLKDWSIELKIPYACLRYRIKTGWSIERAFHTPVSHANR